MRPSTCGLRIRFAPRGEESRVCFRSGDAMQTMNVSELRSVFVGGRVLACGGGGEIEWAEPFLEEMERRSLVVRVASVTELRPRDKVCVPGGIGAGSTPEARERLRNVPQIAPPAKLLPAMARGAFDAFEQRTRTRFDKLLAV
ncbi:MAG TPA: DUF917 family protein, partial [Thermoplasmata archaeon]